MSSDDKTISALASRVLTLARDDILMHLRFFDAALSGLERRERSRTLCMATDGQHCYYDPVFVLKAYKKEPQYVTRCYLHLLLHCIFSHNFQYGKLEMPLWDLAADIAVENVILELDFPGAALECDGDVRRKLNGMREEAGALTAERIYRYLRHNPPTQGQREELERIFARDAHTLWKPREELQVTAEQWKKISERLKADLKSFTKARSGEETLEQNLEEATRDRCDYGELLRRFTVTGEDITVNDEEFDYIYYTYGLDHYGNLPLIEPLEYKEVHKVKEFVIAIDTSASCRGETVKAFLRKTYSLLKSGENFFHKINVHILQCDNEVRSDTKITGDDDFEKFVRYGKLTGFGATDFRPVFSYIEELRAGGEFENLKGLIYFTDGYGIYPERMPDYEVIFAFLDEDGERAPVPPWSRKVILDSDELEDERDV